MILRLFGLLFASAALVLGFFAGWGRSFGDILSKVNSRAVYGMQDGVGSTLWSGAWDSLFVPVLNLPAWAVPGGIALVLFIISAMQPQRA